MLQKIAPQTLRLLALVAVMVLITLFFASQIDGFLNGRLFNRISSSVAIMALIATGQTLVILTRNIDLSVGSVVGFVAFATGLMIGNHPDLNPLVLLLYSALLGTAFGMVNGVFVAYARVPSIIVTLATMALYRSTLVWFSDGKSITTNSLPQWLVDFPNTVLFDIGAMEFRAGFCASVLVVIVVAVAMAKLRPARQIYAVGSNPEAADLAGIDAARVVLAAFMLSGLMAGLAGYMFLARYGTITVVAGLGFELKSVASAVVGGVNIFGGSGSVIGAFLGAILVDLLENGLRLLPGLSEFWREAVLGWLDSGGGGDGHNHQPAVGIGSGGAGAERGACGAGGGTMMARLKSWEGLLLATLAVIFLFNVWATPEFISPANQINLFQLSIEKIIMALVMTFVIINAEIDLSIGSMMGLSACAFGYLFQQGVDPVLCIVICLAIGAVGGAFNGFFITAVGLPSLVVTLATLIGFRGSGAGDGRGSRHQRLSRVVRQAGARGVAGPGAVCAARLSSCCLWFCISCWSGRRSGG